jgi:predicted extracellular nuclease
LGYSPGALTGPPRPFREPGIEAPRVPPSTPCCIPQFDANPERLRIDSVGLGGARIDAAPGAVLTNVVGPLDYNFGAYSINIDRASPPAVADNSLSATPVAPTNIGEFTIASFNMERFFDTTDDPGIDDVALTATAFDHRLAKASLAIRHVLRTPDVIGVEEMENLATLRAVAARVSGDAAASGEPDPQYDAFLVEGNDIGGIDVGFLVRRDRVTVENVTQIGKDETYVNPLNGKAELLNDRPTLQLDAQLHTPGATPFAVSILVNHLRSLSGIDDPTDGARVRAKRAAQAEALAGHIQELQAAGRRIVAVGDFNAFQFNDGYVDVIGTVKGTPAAADQVLVATTPGLVSPALADLVDAAPADQRYSFYFNGNAQELDHVLLSTSMSSFAERLEWGRMDTGFPEIYRNDATRPERASDHDPIVAFFFVPDDIAPSIRSVTPSQTTIWPPNKRMVPVAIAIDAVDGRDPSPACRVVDVGSNEGTSDDWRIDGPLTVSLRADRDGSGSGRIYSIAMRCTDASGNVSTATTTVTVPHDQRR